MCPSIYLGCEWEEQCVLGTWQVSRYILHQYAQGFVRFVVVFFVCACFFFCYIRSRCGGCRSSSSLCTGSWTLKTSLLVMHSVEHVSICALPHTLSSLFTAISMHQVYCVLAQPVHQKEPSRGGPAEGEGRKKKRMQTRVKITKEARERAAEGAIK